MGKIIAVWGTPNSGKTAFTMKLAGHLYETGRRRQTKVVAVLTDVIAPSTFSYSFFILLSLLAGCLKIRK